MYLTLKSPMGLKCFLQGGVGSRSSDSLDWENSRDVPDFVSNLSGRIRPFPILSAYTLSLPRTADLWTVVKGQPGKVAND